MRAMEGCVWRDRERWRLRHITFPQCIKGTSLSVTHTVRMGGGRGLGMARERESERARERRAEGGGDRDEDDEEKRAGKEGSGLFLSYL